jgi:hypothetical protein
MKQYKKDYNYYKVILKLSNYIFKVIQKFIMLLLNIHHFFDSEKADFL